MHFVLDDRKQTVTLYRSCNETRDYLTIIKLLNYPAQSDNYTDKQLGS